MSTGGYVIYDCDIGTDDAWALLMLIKCEQFFKNIALQKASGEKNVMKIPEVYKILGITCVQGNTDVDNCAKNALRVLDSVDRLDIPVYKGCNTPIIPRSWKRTSHFHGLNGFGDIVLPEIVSVNDQTDHAVNIMYSSVCQFPNMVDFLLVGPLTNFAMCINMYGEKFLDKVRHIYIMGGNYRGKGNITKSAEFNFMMDPEAAHIVFENVKQQTITVLPWETCIDGDMNFDMDWRKNVLGKVDTKAMQLMNTVEFAIFEPKGFVKWIVCDAILVAAYCFKHLTVTKERLYHCTVELTGTHTRGQMVLDHLRRNAENSRVIMEMHTDNYKQIISWTGGLIDDAEMEKWMLTKI